MPLERRSYSKSFKAQIIAECAQPDTSIANVAFTHNLNANLVHKWIRVHAQKSLTLETAFIPVQDIAAGADASGPFCHEPSRCSNSPAMACLPAQLAHQSSAATSPLWRCNRHLSKPY